MFCIICDPTGRTLDASDSEEQCTRCGERICDQEGLVTAEEVEAMLQGPDPEEEE